MSKFEECVRAMAYAAQDAGVSYEDIISTFEILKMEFEEAERAEGEDNEA